MTAEADGAVDVARALDHGRWTGFQKWVLALASLAFAVDGLANQVLGIAIPDLIKAWDVPREAFATVRAIGLVGVAIGASGGGVLGDRYGRRAGLIASALLFGAGTMAGVLAHGPDGLIWSQLVSGLGIGAALPNGAALISEFTPLKSRPLAIALGMVFIPVGGVLASLLGTLVLVGWGWKGVFLIGGAAPLLAALLFLLALPESPRFLLGRPGRRAELAGLLARCGVETRPDAVLSEPASAQARTSLGALLGRGMIGDTLAIWASFFLCLLASYTMFSWVPAMLRQQGFPLVATSQGSLFFSIGGVTGGVLGGWLIQTVGSRLSVPALALGGVAGALALGLGHYGPEQGIVPIGLALFVEGVFIAGLNTGIYTLAAHAYPPFARATGVGAAAGVGRIGAVISSYTGAWSLTLWGASGYFILIAGAIAATLVAIALVRNQIPAAAPAAAPAG